MNASDIHISQDGMIYHKGRYIGFTEDEKAYVITNNDRPHCLGWYDHKSELVKMVIEYAANSS